jgi:hypothetical protein
VTGPVAWHPHVICIMKSTCNVQYEMRFPKDGGVVKVKAYCQASNSWFTTRLDTKLLHKTQDTRQVSCVLVDAACSFVCCIASDT